MIVVNAHLFLKFLLFFLAKRLVDTIIIYTFALAIEKRGVAQSGSAPGLGPGGRRFESCRPDVFRCKVSLRFVLNVRL